VHHATSWVINQCLKQTPFSTMLYTRLLSAQCNKAPHTARSAIIIPVPGGPKSSTPDTALARTPRANSSVRCSGNEMISRSSFFA
jgi:hypothetical protein